MGESTSNDQSDTSIKALLDKYIGQQITLIVKVKLQLTVVLTTVSRKVSFRGL